MMSMDTLLKITIYLIIGCLLVIANIWFVRSVLTSFGNREMLIAPFETSTSTDVGDNRLGRNLAHMLHARLTEIQSRWKISQAILKEKPESSAHRIELARPKFRLWPDFDIPNEFFEPVGIDIAVAGIEIGGLLSWIQGATLKNRTAIFTVTYGSEGATITGKLAAFKNPTGNSIWIELKKSDPVAITDAIAYELIHRKLSREPDSRLGALKRDELETLLTTIFDIASLEEQFRLGRPVGRELKALLPKLEALTANFPDWPLLNFVTGLIAENAEEYETAKRYYEQAAPVGDDGRIDIAKIDSSIERRAAHKIKVLTTELPTNISDLAHRIVALSAAFDFGFSTDKDQYFGALIGDFDGQGLTFGVGQWSFGQKTLLPLLDEFKRVDNQTFSKILGDGAKIINQLIEERNIEDALAFAREIQHPTKKYVKEPWRSRFKSLGAVRKFQDVQVKWLEPRFKKSISLADEYGLKSERALALFFDINIQNGTVRRRDAIQIKSEFERLKKAKGRSPNEVEYMTIIANKVSESAPARWVEDVRSRKLAIAKGKGPVHGVNYDLDEFGITLRDFRTGKSTR